LTIKDLLSAVCLRENGDEVDVNKLETSPKWLPTTYNLKTELPKFVAYYQLREKE